MKCTVTLDNNFRGWQLAMILTEKLLEGIARVSRQRRLKLGLTALSLSRKLDERDSFTQELEWDGIEDIDVLLLLRLAEVLQFRGLSDLIRQATLNLNEGGVDLGSLFLIVPEAHVGNSELRRRYAEHMWGLRKREQTVRRLSERVRKIALDAEAVRLNVARLRQERLGRRKVDKSYLV